MKKVFAVTAALRAAGFGHCRSGGHHHRHRPRGRSGKRRSSCPAWERPGVRAPDRICGSVGYNYNIGKYEVTAGQYTDVPQRRGSDRHLRAVQHADMADHSATGCKIQRSGSVRQLHLHAWHADWANRPVNYVSYWDCLPFRQLAR